MLGETWPQVDGYFKIGARMSRGEGRWSAFGMTFTGSEWQPGTDVVAA